MGFGTSAADSSYGRIVKMARLTLLAAAGLALAAPVMAMADSAHFNIASQPLPQALKAFAAQAHMQLLYEYGAVARATGNAVVGDLEKHAALEQLLKNSGLEVIYSSDSAATIRPKVASTLRSGDPSSGTPASQPGGDSLQLAQATPGQGAGSSASVEQSDEEKAAKEKEEKKKRELQEVVVIGSRIPTPAKESAVPVNVYSREDIDRTGASTVTDFLNTLPEVSIQSVEQFTLGANTVQLRGLPVGTTLVLINGRRIEDVSGSTAGDGGFFDMNSIPLSAIERIEILPSGSSAVYGGDALGGIVNVVLKQGFKGFEANIRYGAVTDGTYNETQYNLAGGWKGSKWSLSVVGLYENNGELSGSDRAITASQDFTRFGGLDSRFTFADPGNVLTADGSNLTGLNASFAGIPKGSTGVGLTPADFASTAGVFNKTSLFQYISFLAPTQRYGTVVYGTYEFTPSLQLFTEFLYNHQNLQIHGSPPLAFFSVPANNVYNPFNQDLFVEYLFAGLGRSTLLSDTEYYRPLLGIRGSLGPKWHWELAAWTSRDRELTDIQNVNQPAIDAAVAAGSFNPFQDGPGAPISVLNTFRYVEHRNFHGNLDSASGYVQGPVVELPSGTVQALVGAEYQRDALFAQDSLAAQQPFVDHAFHRHSSAGFTEIKIPIVPDRAHSEMGAVVSAQVAARYDTYSDFGSRASPQVGLEYRPAPSLLFRAAYASAFKPPQLYDLYNQQSSFLQPVSDPLRGGQNELVTVLQGGNAGLKAETGWSKSLGFVFSPAEEGNLNISLTYWRISIENGVVYPNFNSLVDSPQDYPGRVTRAAPSPGDIYPVGPITSIDDTAINFGYIDEAGFDFHINWKAHTPIGEFSPSLAVTQTSHYHFELDAPTGPVNAASQANDNGNWAPHWKGTVGLNWQKNLLSLGIDGRYTGPYRDVTDLTANPRTLGNFWYVDSNARYELGRAVAPNSQIASKAFVTVGARNVLNKLPPYSDYQFGLFGFDQTQYSLQGRFIYAQVGAKF